MSRKHSAVPYNHVFIGDHAVEIHIRSGERILKQDRIFNNSISADFNAPENDRIFYNAFNDAAVGNQRIFDKAAVLINRRRRISDFCKYRPVLLVKQIIPISLVGGKVHIQGEVIEK